MRHSSLLFLLLATVIPASAQISELGAAANYAGLELDAGSQFAISKSSTILSGNVGVVANGNFSFTGGGTITGEIDAGTGATLNITGGSTAQGGVITSDSSMASIVQAANNAASYYDQLSPTVTLAGLSGGTLSGTGGLNVYQINGDISLSRTNLTLSGSASDVFVFNITGDIDLSRSNIVLSGLSPDQVIFNLIGTGTKVTTTGDSDTSGVFLAADGAINISGGSHNSEFIAGGDLTFQSGVSITQPAVAIYPVPELSPAMMAACGALLLAMIAVLPRLQARRKAAVPAGL